ncbi:MAG TPA: hypothetical protein VHQ90_25445 [Thermoanaerobaculia bacterium]|nr:hypothetical protein [Thermoanaerobaculia bacterium]
MPGRIVRSALTGFALAAVLCLAAPPRAEAASWRWGESQAPGSSFLAAAWLQATTLWQWLQGRVLPAAGHGTGQKSGIPSAAAASADPPPPSQPPTGDQGPMIDPNGLPPH